MKSPSSLRWQDFGDGGKSGGNTNERLDAWLAQAKNGDGKATHDLCLFVGKVARQRALRFPAIYSKDDFAQDVVIQFLEQLKEIRNIRHWLIRVCIGVHAAAYRNYHSKYVITKEILPEFPLHEEDNNIETRQLARIDFGRLLEGLEDREQDLMYLRYVDDLPFAEIAKILGMSEGAVKTTCWRIKLRLQQSVEL